MLQLLAGDLGVPAGGWPEPFRTRALEAHRVVLEEPVLDDAARDVLSHPGDAARELLDTLLLPGPAREFRAVRERFGDLSVLPTEVFLFGLASDRTVAFELEPGVELRVSLEAIGEVDETGHRALYLRVNGLPRAVSVLDRTAGVVVEQREAADPDDPSHVAAQMTGVVTLSVAQGDTVEGGASIGAIEAMKMESPVRAARSGQVARVLAPSGTRVEAGDLLLVIAPPGASETIGTADA